MKTNMAILAIALAFCLGSSSIAEPPAASDAAKGGAKPDAKGGKTEGKK